MSYEELGNLINENKADEIRETLNGMSEQELGLFMDLLDDDQAKYLESLLTEDTESKADAPDIYSPGYVYEKVKEEDYPEILSIFEKYGYGKDEMENWLSSKLTDIGDQFAELDSYIGSEPDTEDVNDEGESASTDEMVQNIIEALEDEDGDVMIVGLNYLSLTPEQRKRFWHNLTNEQGEKLAEMLNTYNDIYMKDYDTMVDEMYARQSTSTDVSKTDVNGDGDTDVATADTNGNGEKDTAVVTADSEPEKKEAVKAAKEDLGLDKKDKTSTGKTKGELEDDKDVVSDEKKKDMTCSDATQKNIMAALLDHRF